MDTKYWMTAPAGTYLDNRDGNLQSAFDAITQLEREGRVSEYGDVGPADHEGPEQVFLTLASDEERKVYLSHIDAFVSNCNEYVREDGLIIDASRARGSVRVVTPRKLAEELLESVQDAIHSDDFSESH